MSSCFTETRVLTGQSFEYLGGPSPASKHENRGNNHGFTSWTFFFFTLRAMSNMATRKLCGAILTALLASGCTKGGTEVDKVRCASRLKYLYTFALMSGRKDGHFPHSPEGSVASLQLVADKFPRDFRPESFICPGSDAEDSSTTDINGKLILGPENCSYERVPWRLSTTERNAILFYDKAKHHPRGRNVVLTDGKVLFMEEATFQKRMSEDRKRFGANE